MKVALFNVKYSPNLGDGLLSECLERELSRAGIDAVSIDLAGRDGYAPGSGTRGRMLTVLQAMPAVLRHQAARGILTILAAIRLRPAFRRQLAGCEAVVVGGGNLFTDTDLNFPIKVHAALVESAGLPAAIFAVGVAGDWSPTGRRLFGSALKASQPTFASVRDERSQANWDAQLASTIVRARVVCDPGMLASRHYPRPNHDAAGRTVGLCITDPLALRYHGGHDAIARDMDRWYGDVVAALAEAGWRVTLFNNGSPEDRLYLDRHAPTWTAGRDGQVLRIADFANPAEMVGFIASCNLMVGHRMHACIAAHSFEVPTILLKWDPKLESFAAIAGRSAYFLDPATTDPAALVTMAESAYCEGVDAVACAALIDAARGDVAALAEALKTAVSTRA